MEKLDIIDEVNYKKMMEHRNSLAGFAKEIGIKITSISKGYAKGEIDINKSHLNPGKSVHGGCIFTLADTVGGTAAWTRGNYVVTTSSNITYLNPAIESEKLIAIAKEIKFGKKILVYEVDIWDDSERLIAKVTNSYYNIEKKLDL
ncbi:PaaI family thioesterase [Terrisporobacter glycolicus]|uniref:Thioesterase domain-containing protein n=1 Tax=Terrisporobacter glycolicus ATCC 14880 = DSM 1288 TaxID=1121315 RepID=A0ABZ2EYD0_9FIRM|nr:PaaI family thioesterase [Terrisporobacter glycolicus]